MNKQITIGSVAYDPKVVTIWDGIKDYFRDNGVNIDFVLFSNYEAQVEALFAHFIDIAWNTNIAFVKTDRRCGGKSQVLAMRDTDRGFTSRLIVRKDSPISSLNELAGKRVALGSRDSAQAAVVPEYYLRESGLKPGVDYTPVRFNTDIGKHGDTGRSELDVIESVRTGESDCGAIGETLWQGLSQQGDANKFKSIWTSPPYSHCNFTALPDFDRERASMFINTLLAMDYNIAEQRVILEMEGLKQWLPGERDGYVSVFKAVDACGYLHPSEAVGASQ